MDPRVREHAEIIVDHCVDVQQGDEVVISAPSEAEDLVIALHKLIGERGAHPIELGLGIGQGTRAQRAFLLAMSPEDYDGPPEALVKMAESADSFIAVRGATNTYEASDVPPEKNAAQQKLHKPIRDIVIDKPWVGTQHPAPGNARDAEMSTDAYADFVYNAINRDWEDQRAFQSQMVEILEAGSKVRIASGETTEITMSIEGMHAVNDNAERNLPGGEVFTAPVPDSVEGEVLFDMPLMAQNREIEGIRLSFEEGEVVDFSAEKNEEVLASVLETDDGASRLGELGIGMNRGIDRFTYNMLFDEKMGDTVHLALGRAYDETVGEDVEQNDSAVHMDMIVDMSEDSVIEVDGEVVQRDGTFVFEDEFRSATE